MGLAWPKIKKSVKTLRRARGAGNHALRSSRPTTFAETPVTLKKPFCRTGGTDEEPVFSTCHNVLPCPDTGCTHDAVDGSDYKGEISFTMSGKTCKPWKSDEKWKQDAVQNHWKNSCRNPDNKKLA